MTDLTPKQLKTVSALRYVWLLTNRPYKESLNMEMVLELLADDLDAVVKKLKGTFEPRNNNPDR